MAETLKFGPQWLHNLLDGGQGPSAPPGTHPPSGFPPAGLSGFTGPGAPRTYKLADHRYGREEMLSLYVPAPKVPDGLRQYHSILKDQALQPMAFIPPSEEEQRLMSQSVNSVAVLRMMGRGTGGPAARGGRGGGDRGRGRGRGRGEGGFAGFHRQTSLEDDGIIEKQRGFERGAIGFGVPRSGTFEDGPTSPRRDFSRSMSSDNWRDSRGNVTGGAQEEEEGGDWRRAGPRDKWSVDLKRRPDMPVSLSTGTRGSWRDHRERDRDRDFGRGYDDYDQGGRGGGYERPYRTKNLPEWSTSETEDMENIGTFDSSGAFCFTKDRDLDENEQRRRFEAGRQRALAAGRKEAAAVSERQAENGTETDKDAESGDSEHDRNRAKETDDTKHTAGSDTPSPDPMRSRSKESQSVSPPSTITPDQHASSTSPKEGSPPCAEATALISHQASPVQQEQQHQHQIRELSPNVQQPSSPPVCISHGEVASNVAVVSSVAQRAPNTAGLVNKDRSNLPRQPPTSHQHHPHHHARPQPGVVDDDFGHLEKAAEDLVATWTAEEDAKSDCKAKIESGGVPLDHEDAKKWFYRDPQGDLQGPFKASEMVEWFSAGYFTMNLLVKRGCDGTFQALGELIKRWGRVPFLPGLSPPPLKDPVEIPVQAAPQPDPSQEHLLQQQKMIQQQFMMQQQMYLQQVQMSQLMASQQEGLGKLTPQQQQQQLALQFMLKQQQLMGQQPHVAAQPAPTQHSPPQPGQPQPPKSMSPRAEQQAAFQRQISQLQAAAQQAAQQAQQAAAAQQQAVAAAAAQQQQQQVATPGVSQAADAGVSGFHRSVSQSEPTIWGNANPTTSAGWTAPTSVWDIEQPKTQSMEEIQRLERIKIEQQQQEEAERREAERRRQEEEIRKRQEEEERRRQEKELRRRQEEEQRKQVEMELERQRIEQLERIRLQRESEENVRREEERRRREEEERRRREQEEQRLREAEERRRQLEEQRRKEQEELERKRQEEIRRRQEKAEEMRRQQQESLRRLQQEQMANMHLPSTAQWGSSHSGSAGNGTPSLSEIQEMESARATKEAEEKKRRLEQQRQQLAAIQQQQQQQNKTWAQQSAQVAIPVTTPTSTAGAPSLIEIQQEQALQLERDKQQRHNKLKTSPASTLPLQTAAVWSGVAQASHWAADGAWGNLQNRTSSAGFWDDAIGGASTKKVQASNSNRSSGNGNSTSFPSLSSTVPTQQAAAIKIKPSKAKREEESVQRLFQHAMKPKDEFTQWCENALCDIKSSVDVPTFIVFLQDVESPYEVHDYVRSYLGESKDASEFATKFLERRSKYKNHLRQPEQPEEMWGPAPAVNPNLKYDDHRSSNNNGPSTGGNMNSSKNAAKKKKRMLKVDSSILGFTVHADPERVNMGDIEPIS